MAEVTPEKNKGGRPTKHEFRYKNVGRPSKLDDILVAKLEEAAGVDATIEQTCFYANIVPSTYHRWMNENPELKERLASLRERLPLRAKLNIAKIIEAGDITMSRWLVERKESAAYGEKLKIEHSGDVGDGTPSEDKAIIAEMHQKLKTNLVKRSIEKAKQDGEIKDEK